MNGMYAILLSVWITSVILFVLTCAGFYTGCAGVKDPGEFSPFGGNKNPGLNPGKDENFPIAWLPVSNLEHHKAIYTCK